MKRCHALRALSSDHHRALVWARHARIVATDADASVLLASFEREIAPHFAREENGLLPALLRAGETVLVTQALREHAALRDAVGTLADAPVPAGFAAVADLLEAHVRFEERSLFPRAESCLDASTLAALDDGSSSARTAIPLAGLPR